MGKHPVLKSYVVRAFQDIVLEHYGSEKGKQLGVAHRALCLEYAAQYLGMSKAEEQHYFGQILPFIAAYKIIQQTDPDQADEVLQTIIEKRSHQANRIIVLLLKIPGLYKKIPAICNGWVMKSFSEEAGFQYGKVECSAAEWKADIIRCPYFMTCQKFGCPEIAHYFCDSDDLIYGNLHKNVLWKRTKTLGRGDDVCDFDVEII